MDEKKVVIKYNVSHLKWATTVVFLLGNLLLILYNKTEDKTIFIWWEISVNFLAVFSFVLLSIFPRLYFIFDINGCSFKNRKGREYVHINWEDVSNISYGYFGIIRDGLIIEWLERGEKRKITLSISPNQAKEVYNAIPQVKALMDVKKK